MSIIPLKKLIEYKGNRYELSRAMIELAKSGGNLLRNETKYRKGKYIQTVIKNILDGNIKYEYEDDTKMSVDADAPFKSSKSEYDAEAYAIEETKKEVGMTIESIDNIEVAYELGKLHNIEMPIVEAVYGILYKGLKPEDAVNMLMNRSRKSEN